MKKSTLLFACLVVTSSTAWAASYTSPHQLMSDAIRNGQATGTLTGEVNDKFTKQFNSRGPLLVNATRLSTLPREGCARLEVIFTKKQVQTPKGLTDAILKTQINYCLDGAPPVAE
jgi:hypothetical protein